MAEETKGREETYQYINETILPKKRSLVKRRLGTLLFVILSAVVFGLVACTVFWAANDTIRRLFGGGKEPESQVGLLKPTPTMTTSPAPTPTRVVTPLPTPVKALSATPEPSAPGSQSEETRKETEGAGRDPGASGTGGGFGTAAGDGEATGGSTGENDADHDPDASGTGGGLGTAAGDGEIGGSTGQSAGDDGSAGLSPQYSYLMWYEQLQQTAERAAHSMVTVAAVVRGVDWFQEVYETRTRTTGLILGNDGVELLILTEAERVSTADILEVTFCDGTLLEGSLFSSDSEYGLAVVAVPLARIPEETLADTEVAILADTGEVSVGMPLLALGAPNGYDGSMEFCMVTSYGGQLLVTDGQVSYFTTDMTDHANGHGFLFTLDGRVLGMITHTKKTDVSDGIASVVEFGPLQLLIMKLLNRSFGLYFGIKGQDVPQVVRQAAGVSSGVYVREVESASPALAAGIKSGDILMELGGTALSGIDSLTELLLSKSSREIVPVKLLRQQGDGIREITVDVVLIRKE